MKWRGRVLSKTPLDAWIYQEIIHETKPDVVIEVGNCLGELSKMGKNESVRIVARTGHTPNDVGHWQLWFLCTDSIRAQQDCVS
jgi:cephalosporin hydroxylase